MPISDTPGLWNPQIFAGQTWDVTLSLGTAHNLTGYDARLMARTDVAGTAVALTMGTATGITLGGTAGTIRLVQTATQTSALGSAFNNATTTLVYDLELQSGADVTRLVQGLICVYPEVTR